MDCEYSPEKRRVFLVLQVRKKSLTCKSILQLVSVSFFLIAHVAFDGAFTYDFEQDCCVTNDLLRSRPSLNFATTLQNATKLCRQALNQEITTE